MLALGLDLNVSVIICTDSFLSFSLATNMNVNVERRANLKTVKVLLILTSVVGVITTMYFVTGSLGEEMMYGYATTAFLFGFLLTIIHREK